MNQKEEEMIGKIIELRKWIARQPNRGDTVAQRLLERDFNRLYKAVNYKRDRFDEDLHHIVLHSSGIGWTLTFGIEGGKPTIKVELKKP